MIFVIAQLAGWLFLTAAFAGLAGWAYAALQARPGEEAMRGERERLVRDLAAIGAGQAPENGIAAELERELETLRCRAEIEAARAGEFEHALEGARARAEDATGQIAELQRELERRDDEAGAIDAEAAPAGEDAAALRAWRLRYFEQRVRYLENHAQASAPPAAIPLEWRARVAEARSAHLEQEVREARMQAPAVAAFAADFETDALLRWRMLYLERRVAHLRQSAASDGAPDPELWKWRARFLEARVRELEARTEPSAPAISMEAELAEPPAPAPLAPAGGRPAPLAGAHGAGPDDLTLIDGVSLQQYATLNALGVYHFEQIAAWTPANIAWVDQYLRLRGRIVEEQWVEQARALAGEGLAGARAAESELV